MTQQKFDWLKPLHCRWCKRAITTAPWPHFIDDKMACSSCYQNAEYIEVQLDGIVKDKIWRVPRQHKGWLSVKYKGVRYQLFGGVHVGRRINLKMPLKMLDKQLTLALV